MDTVFHYPPQLLLLLVDTIPLLNRSKRDVLLFFKGAGVGESILADLSTRVEEDRASITKFEIVRTVLTRLNEAGERVLGERREILKRVTEFEEFATCWPDDQLKARGLVAEIRRVIDVKDSFTRMRLEREKERKSTARANQLRAQALEKKRQEREGIKEELFHLFGSIDPHERGRRFEAVINRLFEHFEILVREAFHLTGEAGEGIVEQIDGVVELDGHLYFCEMKWLSRPVDPNDVSRHLVRVYHRHASRGLFVAATEFTPAALRICEEALQKAVVVLATLEEIVCLLEREGDLRALLKEKIQCAVLEKQPFRRIME